MLTRFPHAASSAAKYAAVLAITAIMVFAVGCSSGSSVASVSDQNPCSKPDKQPETTPADVQSWTPLNGGKTFEPETAGYYFTTMFVFVCAFDGKISRDTEPTYLRFFTDGTVRLNILISDSRQPQDTPDVMKGLGMDGFKSPTIGGPANWGCCSRGEGTYESKAFSINEFAPANAGGPVQGWQVTEVGDTSFTAVLPNTNGTGGQQYTFVFHRMA
jgi:hypothetical protein